MRPGFLPALLLMAAPCLAEPAPGIARLADATDPARPLALSVWYPADAAGSEEIGGNAVFEGTAAAPDAPLPEGSFPLVVISHGGLRSAADSGAWLGAALAQAGFIAVEVNAPRPGDAAGAVDEIWQRPRDISRALDLVLGLPAWADRVDASRISALGLALGGTASLAAIGAELDVEQYLRSCDGTGTGAPDCGWYAAQGAALGDVDREGLARPAHDPRFSAAVAIDPEYPHTLLAGFHAITRPTLIVALGGDAPASGGSGPVETAAIPEASVFDAFAICTRAGREILEEEGEDPALCGPLPDGRAGIHAKLAAQIAEFLGAARE